LEREPDRIEYNEANLRNERSIINENPRIVMNFVHRCVRFQEHRKVVEKYQEFWQSKDVKVVYRVQAGVGEILRA
jgi:hypothetical protein